MVHDPSSSSSSADGEPHAAEETLALYALDPTEVDAAASAHIRACALCRRDVAWLVQVLTAADETRDRVSCPPVEQLTAYALGELHGAEERTVAAHMRACVQCAAEVALTRQEFPAATAPARAPLAALRRVVAVFVSAPSSPALALRDATMDDTEPRVYAADGLEIAIRQVTDGAHRGQRVLVGALGASEAPPTAALLARLLHLAPDQAATAPTLVAEVPVAFDAFEFEAVLSGTYQIEILCADRLIVIGPITV